MSEIQVQDYSVALDGPHTVAKLAIVMVPGRFSPNDREIDIEHVHPAIREHLAKWAGGGSRLDLLESFVDDVENMVNDGSHSYEKLADLLREVGR